MNIWLFGDNRLVCASAIVGEEGAKPLASLDIRVRSRENYGKDLGFPAWTPGEKRDWDGYDQAISEGTQSVQLLFSNIESIDATINILTNLRESYRNTLIEYSAKEETK